MFLCRERTQSVQRSISRIGKDNLLEAVKKIHANEIEVVCAGHQDDQRDPFVNVVDEVGEGEIVASHLNPKRFGHHLERRPNLRELMKRIHFGLTLPLMWLSRVVTCKRR